MKYKVDLHTHSTSSYDGGIAGEEYARILKENFLDFAAITDHNEIGFAMEMKQELGAQVIVGEEVTTLEGEIVGLFLEKAIPKNLSAMRTVKIIKDQGGLVYVPHPFEKLRQGIDEKTMLEIVDYIDIVEVFNGRAKWRGKSNQAHMFASKYKKAKASSSDSHCLMGVGRSYSIIANKPEVKNLTAALIEGDLEKNYSPMISYLCPFINKLKKRIKKYV